ncbi:hypothetical protein BJ138DRAFT_1104896 [Hygrophoropsis aurantiaca]|uniref:Uncharacterized protein n=1 Tax=Hygrophoropsis aurantiaca TaxID=72124 RepID=A0ACB7ZZY9_9AGAM|nr:hypothetical protein BJ138DRAFT_1104896 [Hygrophoropsis aurantiaca]
MTYFTNSPIILARIQIGLYCRLAPVALWLPEDLLTMDDEADSLNTPLEAKQWLVETLPSYLPMEAPSDGLSGLLFGFQCVFHGALGSRSTFELRRANSDK